MSPRGQAPEWAEPEAYPFQARSGDTVPGLVLPPGAPPPSAEARQPPSARRPPRASHPPRPRPRPRRRRLGRIVRRVLAVFAVLLVLGLAGFVALLIATPSVSNAPALAQAQDSSHGVAYPGPPVPARFAAALVATEDHRFYSDPGIDPIAVLRVAVGYLHGDGSQQGGATITQQLAKMLYTPAQSGVKAEAEQVALAIKLDVTYSKAEILRMYAAVAYFGQNYYGLGAASCGYFGEPPSALTWPQAAMLAGAVQAPSVYDPLTHPGQARAREAHVLSRLVATGALTQAQASAALAQSLHLVARADALPAPPPGTTTCG